MKSKKTKEWYQTVDSPIVEEWIDQQLSQRGGKTQALVNDILLAVVQGRLVDPTPLQTQIQLLQRQIEQQQELLLEAIRAGTLPADRLMSQTTPPAMPAAPERPAQRPPGGGGLKFTKS